MELWLDSQMGQQGQLIKPDRNHVEEYTHKYTPWLILRVKFVVKTWTLYGVKDTVNNYTRKTCEPRLFQANLGSGHPTYD